jgi:hypothetical protein
VLDNILRSEPKRPSTIRVAAGPRAGRLNDEIDTIVLKCLSKERERRYQTAGELARDIGHYLAGEPIEAKRDSGWYVLRKHVRRHRIPVAVGAAFLLLITGGLIVSLSFWGLAEKARADEVEQRLIAKRAAKTTGTVASQAGMTSAFSQMILCSDKPYRVSRRDLTLHEALDAAVARLDAGEFGELPSQIETGMRALVGKSYISLGLYSEAESQLRAAVRLGRDWLGTLPRNGSHLEALVKKVVYADMQFDLGVCLARQGKFKEAEPFLLDGYRDLRSAPYTAVPQADLVAQVVELYDAWDAAEPGKGRGAEAAEWRKKLSQTSAPATRSP